jgi:hypothetical protein
VFYILVLGKTQKSARSLLADFDVFSFLYSEISFLYQH